MRRLLLVPVLLLAACGGSDEEATPPKKTTTTTEAVAVAASTGCDADPTIAPGEEKVTTEGGRWYLRHVAPGDEPLPVVVDLHGYSEGAEIHAKLTELGTFGDEAGFHTITPHGTGDPVRWDTGLESADVAFIGALLDEVEATLCVDTDRIYVTGLSNGAFMTSTIGCVYADRVAAIAPVAGIRDPEGCDPARPIPVLAIHGTADEFVTYDGGLGEKALDLPAPDGSGRTLRDIGAADQPKGPDIPAITSAWAVRGGCERLPTEVAVTEDVTRLSYACPDDGEVSLYRVTDGGHSWPGSAFGELIVDIVGKTTMTIDANQLMWGFFQNHPLD